MNTNISEKSSTADREIRISRLFNAPIELMWEVWTNPDHIKNWWGPNEFTNTIHSMDVQDGGEWNLTMHGPDGTDFPNYIKFVEMVRPSKMVYKHAADKEDGPGQFVTTVTFESQGNNTLVTLKAVFDSPEDLARVIREHHADSGAIEHLGRLDAYLAKQ